MKLAMNPDPSFYLRKIRRLSQALFVSGALNIGVLAILSYWIARERVPTPYFELKPATSDQQQIPLADLRNCSEVISHLYQQTLSQLINKLHNVQLVENGYKERDLALASLVAFHHFDLSRALSDEPSQKRTIKWKDPSNQEWVNLIVYPGLTNEQFDSILQFTRTERWPITSEGLFLLLQNQKKGQQVDSSLFEAFVLTPEFSTIEILFSRAENPISKQKILDVITEGNWDYLKQFVVQQRQINDLSAARRQKFLLDYISHQSESAAYLLLESEGEFAAKKLDDEQVIAILQLLPRKTVESERFALDLLTSPRSNHVWQQASLRLYEYGGESVPTEWDYQAVLRKFAPEKALPEKEIPKKEVVKASLPVPNKAIPPAAISTIALPHSNPINETKKNSLKGKKAIVISTSVPSSSLPPSLSSSSKPKAVVKPTVKPAASPLSSKTKTKATIKNPKGSAIAEANKKSPSQKVYIVQEGDSLWKISRRFGVEVDAIKKNNGLKSDAIKPGTVLKLP